VTKRREALGEWETKEPEEWKVWRWRRVTKEGSEKGERERRGMKNPWALALKTKVREPLVEREGEKGRRRGKKEPAVGAEDALKGTSGRRGWTCEN
jgi:hypothetical protein